MKRKKKVKLPAASCYDCYHNQNAGTLEEPKCQFGNKQEFIGGKPCGCSSDWVEMDKEKQND